MSALKPCPRAFCGGSAKVVDESGFHSIRCGCCGWSLGSPRDPSPAQRAALVEQWNAQVGPLDALPAFLRARAGQHLGNERWQLLDAAALIEQQAAALQQGAG